MSDPTDGQSATSTDRYEAIARAFRVLSDPMRLRILGLLAEAPATGMTIAGRLALSPATVSHHLSRLLRAGLVTATADGASKIYAMDTAFFDSSMTPRDPRPSEGADAGSDEDRIRHGRCERSSTARR